jgi:hypothetical protein
MTQLELDFGEEFAPPEKPVSAFRNLVVDLAMEAGMTPMLEPWNVGRLQGHITDLEKFAKLVEERLMDKLIAHPSICRQIIDAGLLSSNPAGFKARGLKTK